MDKLEKSKWKNKVLREFPGYTDRYRNNQDNTLNRLKILKFTGFKDIDCYYKYGIFSVYSGLK